MKHQGSDYDYIIRYIAQNTCQQDPHIGVPFILLYNFESAILRSKGDTKRPLIVLTISGIMNVGLNLLLVCVFGMAAEGVAIARHLMKNIGKYRNKEALFIDAPNSP